MFKKMISIVAVAGLVFALAPAVASAAVMPWDSITGSYRLVFVTSTTSPAASTDIAYYNGFVNAAAEGANSDVKGIAIGEWYCIGSTSGVDAKDNTNTLAPGDTGYDAVNDVPIYDLDGVLFATNNAALWSMTALSRNGPRITELGATVTKGVWTGTELDGTAAGYELGDASRVERGTTDPTKRSGVSWIDGNSTPRRPSDEYVKELYALSAPIPEPATITLLAIGAIGVMLKRRRRRV